MLRIVHLGIVCAVLCGVLPATVQGDDSLRDIAVYCVPSTTSPETCEVVTAALNKRLAADGNRAVDAFALAQVAAARGLEPPEPGALQLVQQQMKEGWRSYLEVRATFAASRLSSARSAAVTLGYAKSGRGLLAETSLRLGVVQLALGQQTAAADNFHLAAALAPRQVDDSEFKPEVVAAHRAALAETRTMVSRTFALTPADSQLWIDGSKVDAKNPVVLADGLHLVTVTAPGHSSLSKLIAVSPGTDIPFVISLAVDPEARLAMGAKEQFANLDPTLSTRVLGAVLRYAQRPPMILIASVWRLGGPALIAQRCALQGDSTSVGARLHCTSVIEVGYPVGSLPQSMGALWRLLQNAPLQSGGSPEVQSDARVYANPVVRAIPVAGRPLWQNHWLWLGAAAVAGTSLYLILRSDPKSVPVFSGETCHFGGCQ